MTRVMARWPLGTLVLCRLLGVALSLMVPPAVPKPGSSSYALHDAAAAGDIMSIDLLIAAGIDPGAANDRGSTPLHMAALNGHDDVAALLLDHGASVGAANQDGNTALHAAVGAGQRHCAELLVSRGAAADAASHSGMMPLRIAAQKGDGAMLSALLAGGAEMDYDTAQDAFWSAVQLCEMAPEEGPLSPEVPRLLRHVFDADMQQLLRRSKTTTNVTCMQPAEGADGYGVIDDALVAVPLEPGRMCEGGECCAACSRVLFRSFTTEAEADAFVQEIQLSIVPPLEQFSLQKVRVPPVAGVPPLCSPQKLCLPLAAEGVFSVQSARRRGTFN